MKKNVVIYGAGSGGKKVQSWLPVCYNLVAFIDKQNTIKEINSVPVYQMQWLVEHPNEYDLIIIASVYASEIYQELKMLLPDFKCIEVEAFSDGIGRQDFPWHLIGQCLNSCNKENPAEPILSDLTYVLASYRSLPVYRSLSLIKNRFSMLHVDVIQLLWHLAASIKGNILEIGPYLGGSTISMGLALRKKMQGKLVTIELGGENKGFHFKASNNIIDELCSNIDQFDLNTYVHVVEGDSRNTMTIKTVDSILPDDSVELVFHDADGKVTDDIIAHRKKIKNTFFLIVDDFLSPNDPEKEQITRRSLLELEQYLNLYPLGVFGWGSIIYKAKFK